MKLKLLILSCLVTSLASCSTLTDMSSGGQRFIDGVYFNGRTTPRELADYVPSYNSKAGKKLDEPDYSAMVGAGTAVVVVPYLYSGWYNSWYWDPWYGPWGPGWGPYYPWGPFRPWGPYHPWGPYYPGGCYSYVRSGHNPVGGNASINPYHSGGAGSYSPYRQGGYSGISPAGGTYGVSHPLRGTNTGTSGSSSYGGGSVYHPERSGSYSTGGATKSGSYGGGSYGGGSYGGGSRGGGGGGSFGGGGRGGGSYGGGGGRR